MATLLAHGFAELEETLSCYAEALAAGGFKRFYGTFTRGARLVDHWVLCCGKVGRMQTNRNSTFTIRSRYHRSIAAGGLLLGLCCHLLAQDDPFKKVQTARSRPAEKQPFAAETFQEIADRATPGILGVAVYDFKTGSAQGVNLSRPFSLQSVFKVFVAATVLAQVDAGKLSLDQTLTLRPEDLRDEWSNDAAVGGTFPVRDLLQKALVDSGNSAADALLHLVGGPEKVTAWLRGNGIDSIRIDRDLRTLGREESGVPATLSPGRNASALASQVSESERRAAFKRAQADPRDTATPEGALRFLVALKKGDLLTSASTDLLLEWMHEAKTGQGRLQAGFPSQTVLAHKTGTSPTFEGVTLATNDMGIATLPDGRTLAIVAFLANATGSAEARDGVLAACARVAAQSAATPQCDIDLRRAGQMSDIISNLLQRAEHKPQSEVRAFLKDAHTNYATGDDLLKAAAEHFKIDQKRLAALVEYWRHINCRHAAIPVYAVPDALRGAIPPATLQCEVDLRIDAQMEDVLSNVLVRAEHKPEPVVNAFLQDARRRNGTGDDMLKAAAEHFKIDQKRLAALVEHWRHINCSHPAIPGYAVPDGRRDANTGEAFSPVPVSVFAADVTLHVVLHELGHAVIREFDLMVLGNEETMADAFATHLLTEHFPEHAVRAISARVRSLMIEANEVPRDQWTVRGEHDNDARRAYQIAALAIAADKEKYAGVAEIVGMSKPDIDKARDYGSDIHRAWRRTLAPLMMPPGKVSKEARFRTDDSTRAFVEAGEPSLASTIESSLQRIDWHSQVTVDFVWSQGGAGWNRSKRTVTVNSEYLERFIAQGVKAEAQSRQ
jgi:beta-lactamase class A